MSDQRANDTVLHQDEHEAIIDERVAETLDGVTEENVAIEDLEELTGGQSPTEVEHNLVVTTLNAVLAALRSNGTIPAE